ncbi:hypothetical protein LGQ02_01295 [Bacillus shivajii]|uniref:hypothetical protein n=1 Tax=Bacillus shivajii TaxID=1983719 RepID=UPI001CF94C97|nr:hypothetical protein [Bacillus shivajii]UCZ53465.1 hypothetical protein LGQ02_01295 [Bacillus shivajii]
MINRLVLGEAAYFYYLNSPLSERYIKGLFIKVSSKKSGPYTTKIIQDRYTFGDKRIKYSLCIFKFKAKPNFLEEGSEEEIKYAYLLILEYSNMVIINKKNISGLNTLLKDYISDVEYTTISRLFLSNTSNFEKLTMINMDISNNAIRRRNIEANDLTSVFSPVYSSKYIINNIRINDKDSRISLALNTSKINKLGKKVSIDEYFQWAVSVVDKVEAFQLRESYLDNFSAPVDNQEELKELEPTSILFLFNDLLADFERGLIEEVRYNFRDKSRKIDLQKYLSEFDTLFKVERIENNYIVPNSIDNKLKLKRNKVSLSIQSKKLKNITINFFNKEVNLQEYINKNQNYIITFSQIEHVYSHKKLFKDSKLLGNLEAFLDVLEPYEALSTITSEKGNNSPDSSSFNSNSLFFFIENTLASNVDYLFCDDLGNEFADFISINDSKNICYYHAKSGNSRLSASDFQVVLAQALKNIGNMSITSTDLERKIEKWNENIKDTNISLTRIGDTAENGGKCFIKTLSTPNSIKEVYIVVNFLSKSALESGLNRLKQGRPCQHEIIQILWLLSSFISTCKELGLIVRITCLP